jgi:hypothetical protein
MKARVDDQVRTARAAAIVFWGDAFGQRLCWTIIPACPYCGSPHRHEGAFDSRARNAGCTFFTEPGAHTYTLQPVAFNDWAATMGVDSRLLRAEFLAHPLRHVHQLDRALQRRRGTALLALAKLGG